MVCVTPIVMFDVKGVPIVRDEPHSRAVPHMDDCRVLDLNANDDFGDLGLQLAIVDELLPYTSSITLRMAWA